MEVSDSYHLATNWQDELETNYKQIDSPPILQTVARVIQHRSSFVQARQAGLAVYTQLATRKPVLTYSWAVTHAERGVHADTLAASSYGITERTTTPAVYSFFTKPLNGYVPMSTATPPA